jgi:pimeloyl-ACP methyl ester carboxylesterase
MKGKRLVKTIVGITGAVSMFLTYLTFRRQKKEAVTELLESSRIIQTACGPIEYASIGDGETVLICHGGGGGYDQGLLFSWPNSGFQFVAPSRPGYLGTPLETGESFEAQADAYAALLDALDVYQVAVLAASGGGPSALQFALHHPDRCWGVILLSAISQSTPAFPFFMQQITEKVIPRFDFIPWVILNTSILDILIDRNTRSQIGSDVHKKSLLKKMMRTLFPASLRVEGMLNDIKQIAKMPIYPLEEISAPALVIHGDKDSIVPFTQGRWSAGTIPDSEFLPIENGDHLSFITHKEIIEPAVLEFLESHAP